jgi:hypothetical protein
MGSTGAGGATVSEFSGSVCTGSVVAVPLVVSVDGSAWDGGFAVSFFVAASAEESVGAIDSAVTSEPAEDVDPPSLCEDAP